MHSFYENVFPSRKLKFNDIQENVSNLKTELLYFKDHLLEDSYEYIKNNLLDENCLLFKRKIYVNLLPFFINIKNDKKDIFKILIKSEINLSLLIKYNIDLLIKCFKNNKNLDEVLYLSKILKKLFITKNSSVEKDYIYININKINELLKIKAEDDILFDCLEQVIYLFYEIITRAQKIEKPDLERIEQILWKLYQNKENLRYCLFKGFLFLSKRNYTLNIDIIDSLIEYIMNEIDSKILDILILQFKLDSIRIEGYLDQIFNILINYCDNSIIESKILLFIWDALSPDLLSKRKSIEMIEEYYNKMNNNNNDENKNLFYKILQKIPDENRGPKIDEILKNRKNINLNININNFKNNIYNKQKIDLNDLRNMENNLNDPEIIDSLIIFLKKQNELFSILDLEKITKVFNRKNKELFDLIIDKEIQFNENSLTNLLSGFYNNNEKYCDETIKIFRKIKSYQNSFPEIIEINLKLEDKLKNYDYLNKINKDEFNYIFYNLTNLKGFSSQHIKFIKYIFDNFDLLNNNDLVNEKLIINEISKLVSENYFDIGLENFQKFLKILPKENFISIYYKLLYKKKLSSEIKEEIYHHLYTYALLQNEKDEEIIFTIIDKIKFFIDFDFIPQYLIEIFISFIKKDISSRITTEIIYFLGNYFSIDKNFQKSFLDEIINLQKKEELYKEVLQRTKDNEQKNKIFYLYSSLNYLKYYYNDENFENIYEVPKIVIIKIINNLNNNENKELLLENLKYFENYFHCETFDEKRDKLLRELYFNEEPKNYEKLKDICYDIE